MTCQKGWKTTQKNLGHARNVCRGDGVHILRKNNKHAHMTERLHELDERSLLFYFVILI